jgi:protein-arginine kinase activator protein McsA
VSDRYDAELYVEACPFIQTLTCPECESGFEEFVSEQIAGGSCPECNAMLRFIHDRHRRGGDSVSYQTEQTTLTDGGDER